MSSRTAIAEHYLTMLRGTGDTPTARMTVRYAERARVPFGRIVGLLGIPAETVVDYIEGGE